MDPMKMIIEAWNFGQFSADFNQPLAQPIKDAICKLCEIYSRNEKACTANCDCVGKCKRGLE